MLPFNNEVYIHAQYPEMADKMVIEVEKPITIIVDNIIRNVNFTIKFKSLMP